MALASHFDDDRWSEIGFAPGKPYHGYYGMESTGSGTSAEGFAFGVQDIDCDAAAPEPLLAPSPLSGSAASNTVLYAISLLGTANGPVTGVIASDGSD